MKKKKSITLQLSSPIASCATTPILEHRLTGPDPSRSAIIGLIRCAMGVPRNHATPELDNLEINVLLASHSGKLRDFQTVRDAVTHEGTAGRIVTTQRHYLTEFYSQVEISGDAGTIERIQLAMAKPQWQLYIGRRNCVPDLPVLAPC